MNKSWQLPRRTFLKGLGTAIALPVFESMMPGLTAASSVVSGGKSLPKRMAYVYVPNGVNMANWTPKAVGSDFDLPATLEPLKAHQKDLLVLSGLAHDSGRAYADGRCRQGEQD